jgi:hypothetical protein
VGDGGTDVGASVGVSADVGVGTVTVGVGWGEVVGVGSGVSEAVGAGVGVLVTGLVAAAGELRSPSGESLAAGEVWVGGAPL